jgi:hypothetical protein
MMAWSSHIKTYPLWSSVRQDILAPFMESGGLEALRSAAESKASDAPARKFGEGGKSRGTSFNLGKGAAPVKGGVFKKGAKAMGIKSAAERVENLKIRYGLHHTACTIQPASIHKSPPPLPSRTIFFFLFFCRLLFQIVVIKYNVFRKFDLDA